MILYGVLWVLNYGFGASEHYIFVFLKKLYVNLRNELRMHYSYSYHYYNIFLIHKPFLEITQLSCFFFFCVCFSPWTWRLRAPKRKFWKDFIRTSVTSWGSITYTHILFSAYFFHLQAIFRNYVNILVFHFSCVLAHRSGASEHLKTFSWKNFTRTSIMSWGSITYTHTLFKTYFFITSYF